MTLVSVVCIHLSSSCMLIYLAKIIFFFLAVERLNTPSINMRLDVFTKPQAFFCQNSIYNLSTTERNLSCDTRLDSICSYISSSGLTKLTLEEQTQFEALTTPKGFSCTIQKMGKGPGPDSFPVLQTPPGALFCHFSYFYTLKFWHLISLLAFGDTRDIDIIHMAQSRVICFPVMWKRPSIV